MRNYSGDAHADGTLVELVEVVRQLAQATGLTTDDVAARLRDNPPVIATDDSRWQRGRELLDRLERQGHDRLAVIDQLTEREPT